MRSSVLFIICVLVSCLLTSNLRAEPPEKETNTPPTLAEETERLNTLKQAEFQKLKAKISSDTPYEEKLSCLKNIAALEIPEAIELLSTLYDNPLSEETQPEQKLIVELLGGIGSPACSATILKAVGHPGKDGKVREAAVGAVVRVMDKQALPYLKKLTEDKVEAVQNRAWTELLKIQDLGAMRHIFKLLDGKEKLVALAMIKEAHFTEAAKEVAEIAKETDFSKGPNEKILKLKALEVALDLGHKESVEVTIELLGAITEEQAKVLEVKSPLWLLNIYTHADFRSDKKKWQEWWENMGKTTPLYSSYTDSTTLAGIGAAIVDLLRSKDSGIFEKSEVIYCLKTPLAEAAGKKDKKIRLYNSKEMQLLGFGVFLNSVGLQLRCTNGRFATVTYNLKKSRIGNREVPLQYEDGAWQIAKPGKKPKK